MDGRVDKMKTLYFVVWSLHCLVFVTFASTNQPPILEDLPDNLTVSAKAVFKNDVMLAVNASDPDGDTVKLLFDCDPPSGPFRLRNDNIETRRDLLQEKIFKYNCTIEATDLKLSTYHTLVIYIFTDINTKPVLSNLDQEIYIPETQASGVVLYDVDVSDPDRGDKHTFSMTVQPSAYADRFTLDNSSKCGEIKLADGKRLNYEGNVKFWLIFSVFDGVDWAKRNGTLTIVTVDMNEPPYIRPKSYSLFVTEGEAGKKLGNISFACTDFDAWDRNKINVSLGKITPSQVKDFFYYDLESEYVILIKTYDIDTGIMPLIVKLEFLCQDKYDVSDTADITIEFSDINDNHPTLAPSSLELTVTNEIPVGKSFVLFHVTECDLSPPNNQYNLHLASVWYGHEFFQILPNGSLVLKKQMKFTQNKIISFSVVVQDQGLPPLQGHATVTVLYINVDSAANGTESGNRGPCFLCTTAGITIASILVFEGACVLSILLYIKWKYCIIPVIRQFYKVCQSCYERCDRVCFPWKYGTRNSRFLPPNQVRPKSPKMYQRDLKEPGRQEEPFEFWNNNDWRFP